MTTSRADRQQATGTNAGPQTVRWDDAHLKSSYANVCNVSSTREEVVLVFGVNQAWERDVREVKVQLTDRIILSPFAAKRLSLLLNNVVQQYETRFGVLNVEIRRQEEPAPSET